jgi:serine/threonine protein kinase
MVTPEGVYEIEGLMNQGGFGQIYAASIGDSSVAIKVCRGEAAGERLERESKISTWLSKETLNILPMRILNVQTVLAPYRLSADVALPLDMTALHVGQMRNLSTVAQTLSSYIASLEKPIEKSVFILRQTASCIERVHGSDAVGYLHGDISADNIFFAEELNTVIPIDFGNALAIENGMYAEIPRRDFVYNRCFMPPELRRSIENGEKYIRLRPSADIYSLGVLFYALLFEMPTEAILEHLYILAKSKVQKLGDTGVCDKEVVSLLDHFFENSLAEDARHRYGSVSEMVDVLDEILVRYQ